MRLKRFEFFLLSVLFLLPAASVFSQCPITSLGQNPATAFPVCGTNTFVQQSVNLCGGKSVPNPKCNTNVLSDVNPYWYKFTCFKDGTLGFTIEPNSSESDYDWQVFDITGKNPDDVYTNASLTISSNWSQYFGSTGTASNAAELFQCEGPVPKTSKMPLLKTGHEYLLLVSHFSNTQAGYKLIFGGGTASITDTTKPKMVSLLGSCRTFGIKLNKKLKCSSLAADGSDFVITPANAKITGAISQACGAGFDMDSVILQFDHALTPGNYVIKVKKGTDGNTLLDYCDNPLPEGDSLSVTLLPSVPTPMDSMMPFKCKPAILNLVFRDPILCSSIAADASDFSLTGPVPVSITQAAATCVVGGAKTISLALDKPLTTGGVYTLILNRGSDGNTLMNECDLETPAGSMLSFRVYDTVSAKIDYAIASSCKNDTVYLSNAGAGGINSWIWQIDKDTTAFTPQLTQIFDSAVHEFTLTVANEACTDQSSFSLDFDKNRVKAAFDYPAYVCPFDTARFTDKSKGMIETWFWDFGNGGISRFSTPEYQFYPVIAQLKEYKAKLTIVDSIGCRDSVDHTVIVPGNCYIAVPTAFTPNGDGLNDYLYPLSAYKAQQLEFTVYNRYGELVFKTTDWTKKWDGRIGGNLQSGGTYAWHLVYFDPDKQQKIDLRGTTTLIR